MVCRVAKEKGQSSNDNLFGIRVRNTTWTVKKQRTLCNVCSAVSIKLRGENVLFYYTSSSGGPAITMQEKKV